MPSLFAVPAKRQFTSKSSSRTFAATELVVTSSPAPGERTDNVAPVSMLGIASAGCDGGLIGLLAAVSLSSEPQAAMPSASPATPSAAAAIRRGAAVIDSPHSSFPGPGQVSPVGATRGLGPGAP